MSREASRKTFSVPANDLLRRIPAWECHVHTLFSDGRDGILDCAARARDLGLTRIIFTEHTEPWKARTPGWFKEYAAQVHEAARLHAGALEVFLGLEAPATDLRDGLDLSAEMRAAADCILGTAHRYPGLEGGRVRDLSPAECVELEFETLKALARNPGIDAIAHLGGTCGLYCAAFPEDLAAEVIRMAAQNGIAIELNSRYHQPIGRMLDLCVQAGARVTIGSDAHSLDEIGTAFAALLAALAKEPS